ncbi:FAD-dependent monooxygenase [Kitasatospora cathayae]|uniref:FAD-dependent monooxygenase n=1 Tax=Kitasatospora cathayae TaxID=3004092 RepID=A0ABY7PWV0_9ACTN|nr:FAD-dependent monooxygenase [Kitasatospora sp. HUAS 3-15]WBP84856.1 FAD-dependent monooxygenase [Kitasatospora sp. HUAS 3-15]
MSDGASKDEVVDVLIAGAGPAGLTLAGELARAGVRALVLEREPEPPGFCRGFNLNARSLELLDRRGLAARFLAEGPTVPTTIFVGPSRLDLAAMRTKHPYALGIPQTRVEELLAEWAVGSGARLVRGRRLTGLRQDDDGVTVEVDGVDGPSTVRCRWLVGCDGGRSTVRKAAGIGFPGTPARKFTLLGDVTLADPSAVSFGPNTGPDGRSVFAIPRPGYVRLITADPAPPADPHEPVPLDSFQRAVDAALGHRAEIAEALWLTRFGDAARLAERFRTGRVLLAGDAAHIHPPAGAIGVNAAIDDAVNLGWKLALVTRGQAAATLLDTYHDERHAAGERLLRNTRAQAVLAQANGDEDHLAPVRDLLAELAGSADTAGPLAEAITAVGTRYPASGDPGHPWAGRMVPDVPLGQDGEDSLTALLTRSPGGALLLDGSASSHALSAAARPWADRVTTARTHPHALERAHAVLVRPDGHAAWIGAPSTPGDAAAEELRENLARWFGRGRIATEPRAGQQA